MGWLLLIPLAWIIMGILLFFRPWANTTKCFRCTAKAHRIDRGACEDEYMCPNNHTFFVVHSGDI